jgi:hypothetical protein
LVLGRWKYDPKRGLRLECRNPQRPDSELRLLYAEIETPTDVTTDNAGMSTDDELRVPNRPKRIRVASPAANIEIMAEDESIVKKKRIAKPKLSLSTPPTVRSIVKKPEDFSSIDDRSHTIFDVDEVPEVTEIPELTVGNRLRSELAENSQIESLKAQLADTQELLRQTLSNITAQIVVPRQQPNNFTERDNTETFQMPPPVTSSFQMPPPVTSSLQMPSPVQNSFLMSPPVVGSLQLPPTIPPSSKSVPSMNSYMQFNFMLQMQRDNIRVQAEREMHLERAKEDRIKAQELLIYQTMFAYNGIFNPNP